MSRGAFAPNGVRIRGLRKHLLSKFSFDKAGTDGVDTDIFMSVIDRHALREQNYSALRRCVSRSMARAIDAKH